MKYRIQILMSATLVSLLLPAFGAAQSNKSESRSETREVRVNSNPIGDRERRVFQRADKPDGPMETVAFLGVETGPVSPAVATQLGLARGTGLVVNHIVPESPAAPVLQQHDILLRLDDQILIETRQLAVLIRNKKEGDEVTLTYLRGGKEASAKVKLGKTQAPKFALEAGAAPSVFPFGGAERFEYFVPKPGGEREEADRLLSLLPRAPGAPDGPPGFIPRAPRVRIERIPGPGGVLATSVNARNSSIVYSDDDGSLDLRINEGVKTLVAKNTKGEEVFSGAVTTPEDRKAVPAEVRQRLERLEHMNGVTFNTDPDFQGAPTKVVRPRGIAFPLPQPGPVTAPLPRRPVSF